MFSLSPRSGPSVGRRHARRVRAVLALVAVAGVLVAGCSSDSDDDATPGGSTTATTERTGSTDRTTTSARTGTTERTTTTVTGEDEPAETSTTVTGEDEPAETSTTVTGEDEPAETSTTLDGDDEPAETTTTADGPTPTTTPSSAPPGGPSSYTGTVDGEDADVTVTFTRATGIEDFEVSGLTVECQPLASTGDPKTRTIDLAIAAAPVAADGSVMFTQPDAPYEPSLSGSFAADGSFAGGLFLSGERDDFVCGGEFSFIAEPG